MRDPKQDPNDHIFRLAAKLPAMGLLFASLGEVVGVYCIEGVSLCKFGNRTGGEQFGSVKRERRSYREQGYDA